MTTPADQTPFDGQPGFLAAFPITVRDIGGWMTVWYVPKANHALPPIKPEDPHKFAIRQFDGDFSSPGCMTFQNSRTAKKNARMIADGSHESIMVRSLRPQEEVPAPIYKGDENPDETEASPARPPAPAREDERGGEQEAESEVTDGKVTVMSSPEAAAMLVQGALSAIPIDKVRTVIEEGLASTIWVVTKDRAIEATDHRTRLAAAKLYIEHFSGRPVERTIIERREPLSLDTIRERLLHSSFYMEEFERLIAEIKSQNQNQDPK